MGARDRPVVEQAQVAVPFSASSSLACGDVDLAAEEVGVDAAEVPGLVMLEPAGECFEQKRPAPRLLDLLEDGRVV